MTYIIAMSLCCRASHAITPAVAHLIIPVYFYLYDMQYCKTTKNKHIMNKKNVWTNLVITNLIISIALIPASLVVTFFNHRIAIAMLFSAPMFLVIAVICMFASYISTHDWED